MNYLIFNTDGSLCQTYQGKHPEFDGKIVVTVDEIPDITSSIVSLVDGQVIVTKTSINDVPPTGFHRYDKDNDKWLIDDNGKSLLARKQRDLLLKESDWTQVPDAPVDADAWKVYRQALRDITNQAGFPDKIDWPIKPE